MKKYMCAYLKRRKKNFSISIRFITTTTEYRTEDIGPDSHNNNNLDYLTAQRTTIIWHGPGIFLTIGIPRR